MNSVVLMHDPSNQRGMVLTLASKIGIQIFHLAVDAVDGGFVHTISILRNRE